METMKGLLHPIRREIPRPLKFATTTLVGIAKRETNAGVTVVEADAAFAAKGFPRIILSRSAGSTLPMKKFAIPPITKKKRLLGAPQEVWADMCHGGCFPAGQRVEARKRHTSHRHHARIRNRPPPVGGKEYKQRTQVPRCLEVNWSQTQNCCRMQTSAMSKQHPVACIPKSK